MDKIDKIAYNHILYFHIKDDLKYNNYLLKNKPYGLVESIEYPLLINKNNRYIPITTDWNNKKYVLDIKRGKDKLPALMLIESINTYYLQNIMFKLTDYKKSSAIFGYKNSKKETFLSGKYVQVNNILFNYKCKKDGVARNVYEVYINGKNLKILAEEITPVYPDLGKILKGYNSKKDRTIRINDTVIVKHHKKIPYKEKCKVNGMISLGTTVTFFDKKRNVYATKPIDSYMIDYKGKIYMVNKNKIVKND